MSKKSVIIFFVFAVFVIGGVGVLIFAHDHSTHDHRMPIEFGDLHFYEPRLYEVLPGGGGATAGYIEIANNGDEIILLSISAPFANKSELHTTSEENGIAKMRPLPNGLPLPAGETTNLQPGGKHFMFTDISATLTAGAGADKTEPVILHFSNGQNATVNFSIIKHGEDVHQH